VSCEEKKERERIGSFDASEKESERLHLHADKERTGEITKKMTETRRKRLGGFGSPRGKRGDAHPVGNNVIFCLGKHVSFRRLRPNA